MRCPACHLGEYFAWEYLGDAAVRFTCARCGHAWEDEDPRSFWGEADAVNELPPLVAGVGWAVVGTAVIWIVIALVRMIVW